MDWVPFLNQYIWFNSGFGCLRRIRSYIEGYESRFDPLVIPLEVDDPFDDVQALDDDADPTASPGKYYTAADYHALYVSGSLTPTAVAKAILPLIRRDTSPPGLHSIAWFDVAVDRVLAAAEASTKRYQANKPLGVLDGVPTAVKDEYDLDGYTTCLGSVNDYTGDEPYENSDSITSWCARQLQEAGAVILGKLSMHEFGLDTTGTNLKYGTPTNPHNPNYYTGGSSSGCAYTVSAGLVPFAMGSDGGGSVRIPASLCSVFGLKPTHGRVSYKPGVNHANTVSVNGPLAADISSLAAAYEVIATPGPGSTFPSTILPPKLIPLSAARKQVIPLGISKAWFARADRQVQDLCNSLLAKIVQQTGNAYELIPIEIPFLAEGQIAHAITILTDGATLLPDTSKFAPANRILLALGRAAPATDYLLAQKLRQALMQHLSFLWQQHPGMLIISPTTSSAGWPIMSRSELVYGLSDGDRTLRCMEYVWLANFAGIPSITMPAGFARAETPNAKVKGEDDGMVPVGLMAMGEWGNEKELLQFGLDVEEVGRERYRRPPIWVDIVEKAKKEMQAS